MLSSNQCRRGRGQGKGGGEGRGGEREKGISNFVTENFVKRKRINNEKREVIYKFKLHKIENELI